MYNFTINKVKVFISSKCGGRYSIVRKALEKLFTETGFCFVYCFEEDCASSLDVKSAYLSELSQSDVVVFLIDNKDGVTDAVQSEIDKARESNIKCIFIFCDENQKEKTPLQTDLQNRNQEKYYVIHEFSDFSSKAYESVLIDIVRLYRNMHYSYDDFVCITKTIDTNSVNTAEKEIINLKKKEINRYKSLYNILPKLVGDYFSKEQDDDPVSYNMSKFFRFIIGDELYQNVDLKVISEYVSSLYDESYKEIVDLRFEALQYILCGNLKDAENVLSKTIKKLEGINNYPRWLKNDIAIDLRNIKGELNRTEGGDCCNTEGQDILNDDDKFLFNPILDRFNYDLEKSIVEYEKKELFASPFLIEFQGYDGVLINVANAFIAAVYSVSYTHIKNIRSRLSSYLILKSCKYANSETLLLVTKLFILDGDYKRLDEYMKNYVGSLNSIDSDFITQIQNVIDNIQNEQEKFIAQSISLAKFGYYYRDDLYKKVLKQYFIESKRYEDNEYYVGYILDVIVNTQHRNIDSIVSSEIISLLSKSNTTYQNKIYDLVYRLNVLQEFNEKEREQLISLTFNKLKKFRDDKKEYSLLMMAQNIRRSYMDKAKKLDKIIERKAPEYYKNTYAINVFGQKKEECWKYINDLVNTVHNQNMTQGKDGVIYGYVFDCYENIVLSILINGYEVKGKHLKKVLGVIEETLLSKGQTSKSKYRAISLLLVMQIMQPSNRQIKSLVSRVMFDKIIICSDGVFSYPQYNESSIGILWNVLESVVFDEIKEDLLSNIINSSVATQILLLSTVDYMLMGVKKYKNVNNVVKLLWPSLTILQNSKVSNVRSFVARIYSRLYGTSMERYGLEKLSAMIIDENAVVKGSVIQILKSQNALGDQVEYIYQKGRLDNNYFVRKVASMNI